MPKAEWEQKIADCVGTRTIEETRAHIQARRRAPQLAACPDTLSRALAAARNAHTEATRHRGCVSLTTECCPPDRMRRST